MRNDLVFLSWGEWMKDFLHELMKFLKVNFNNKLYPFCLVVLPRLCHVIIVDLLGSV